MSKCLSRFHAQIRCGVFDCFDQQRHRTLRAQTRSTSGTTTPIRAAVESLRNELRKHIDEMAPSEYLNARKFLDSLAYEGTLPVG